MSNNNFTHLLSIQGSNLTVVVGDDTVKAIQTGDYKTPLGKALSTSLLKEALGKGELGKVELRTINSALKPFMVESIEQWMEFLAVIKEKGFTRRVQVFKYLYEQGYFGVYFSDYVAEILTQIDQPSIIRCTRNYGHVLYAVNQDNMGEVVTATNITDFARHNYDKTLAYAEKIQAKKVSKKQYPIKQIAMNQIMQDRETKDFMLNPNEAPVVVSTSTSVMFEAAEDEGMEILVLDMSTLDEKDEYARFLTILSMLSNGIVVDGVKYFPLAQSASQSRSGKLYMGSKSLEEIKEFRDRISYGAFKKNDGELVEVAKCESRVTLSSTNTTNVGFHDFDYTQIVKDMELSVSYRAKKIDEVIDPTGGVIGYTISDTEVTVNNATDGNSYIHPRKAAEFAKRLGLISRSDLEYFLAKYRSTNYSIMKEDERLFTIFNKIPNVFQVRCGAIKGLVVMWDFDNELDGKHKGQSFVLHESIVKAIPDPEAEEQPEWRVANINNKRWGRVRLSAQFMTVLGMDLEDVSSLVHENIELMDKKILEDPKEALKFVNGIVRSSESDTCVETDGKELATKVAAALTANPRLIKDKWVRRQLRTLVKTAITRLKYGAVTVNGIYAYAVTDPRAYFRATLNKKGEFVSCEDCLQPGQYYLNGMTKTVAGLRAPHIHETETQLLNLVDDEELWFLKNLIVFNPFDMTAQASQGMDFDGDQMLITDDIRVVRNVKRDNWMILQGLNKKAVKAIWDTQSVLDLYAKRSKRDNVGRLSNYALLFKEYKNYLTNLIKYNMLTEADKGVAAKQIAGLEERVIKLACLIGAEIDKAKTDIEPTITDDLVAKVYPTWWPGFKAEIKKEISNTPEARASYRELLTKKKGYFYGDGQCLTPVGTCYEIVSKWEEESAKDFAGEAGSVDIARSLAKEVLIADVTALFPEVELAVKAYSAEMRALRGREKFIAEDQFKEAMTELYDRHQIRFDGISDDKVSLAAATYMVSNDGKSSNSAPWVFCFEGLMTLFSKGTHTMLFEVPGYLTEGELVESDNGGLFINKRFAGETSLPDGRYGVQMVGGRPYVLATRKGKPTLKARSVRGEVIENQYKGEQFYGVTAMGFKYNAVGTAKGFADALEASQGIAEIHVDENDRLLAYIDGIAIASIKAESVQTSGMITATRVQFNTRYIETSYPDKRTGQLCGYNSLKLTLKVLESVEARKVVLPEDSYLEQNFNDIYDHVELDAMQAQFDEDNFYMSQSNDYMDYSDGSNDYFPEM